MTSQNKMPETLMDAIRYFSDADICHDFVSSLRWPSGVHCVHCESENVGLIKSRKRFQCRACRRQFGIRHNTIFEDSPLPLDKWLCAIWMIANAKNGVSNYEIARGIGVTQKSAWFMLQRIRLAMQTKSFMKLSGEVEVDETFIGGKARFMHKGKCRAKGRGSVGKIAVMGLLERHGEVRTEIVENVRRKNLDPRVREHVEERSTVYTDSLPSYNGLSDNYTHRVIDHAECYAKGNVHTNGLENYWSLFKRCIKGTYVSVEPFHLFRYLDEQAYRFNTRKLKDSERFKQLLGMVSGKSLRYDKLTGECVS